MLTVEQVRPLYQNDAAHDFDHVLRVLTNAMQIGRAEAGTDFEILRTATLLHDIARADQKRTGQDHAIVGASRAKKLLTKLQYPDTVIEAVCHAIATHRFRANTPPQTLEAKILYDADKLDSIGAIGIARVFAYGGHINRPLWRKDTAGEHTALQEFRQKLMKVKDNLFTTTAQQIAQQRHQFMVAFFEQLNAEIQGL